MKFKAGQKVVCLESPVGDDVGFQYTGEIVTVLSVDRNGNIENIKEWAKKGFSYENSWFAPANSCQISPFKSKKYASKIYVQIEKEREDTYLLAWDKESEPNEGEVAVYQLVGIAKKTITHNIQ